jgi:arylsulfatase A-like enzyme
MNPRFLFIVTSIIFTPIFAANVFNLTADPYESTDVSQDSDYTASIDTITAMSTLWLSKYMDPDTSGTDVNMTVKTEYYEKCGGICPYLNNTYSKTVEQLYDYSGAPHIVFIMVDDWGYNDVGYHSTYMPFVSPNIDDLAQDGIIIENYFTHESCTPSRGAFITGRYALRLGFEECDENDGAELPLSETTLAQEMKSAGYRTYMVGKWHLGYSSDARTPLYRGFDRFYGYYNAYIDYWTKDYSEYLDLQNEGSVENDTTLISSDYHAAYIFNDKVEQMIKDHAISYASTPMFLYYALQLVHYPREAPDIYIARCSTSYDENAAIYCAQNLMLDEAIANVTCALKSHGLYDNSIIVIAGDNGGEGSINGTSYPFRGNKFDTYNGGVRTNAFVHSPLIDDSLRGQTYSGRLHVTDWMPTLMGLATNNEWTNTTEIDGVDQWSSILYGGSSSPRTEIIHYVLGETHYTIEYEGVKVITEKEKSVVDPASYFEKDLDPDGSRTLCSLYSSENPDAASFYTADENYETVNVVVDYSLLLPFVLCSLSLAILYMGYCKPLATRKKNYGVYTYQSISNEDCDP